MSEFIFIDIDKTATKNLRKRHWKGKKSDIRDNNNKETFLFIFFSRSHSQIMAY